MTKPINTPWSPTPTFARTVAFELGQRMPGMTITIDEASIKFRPNSLGARPFTVRGTVDGRPMVFDGAAPVGTYRMVIAARDRLPAPRKPAIANGGPQPREVLRAAARRLETPQGQVLQLDLSNLDQARLDLGCWKVEVPAVYYPRFTSAPEMKPLAQAKVLIRMESRSRRVSFVVGDRTSLPR